MQVATIEMTLRYSHLSPEVGRSGVAARSAWQFHGNGHQPVGQLAERREKNWWRRRESNADLTPRRVSWNRMESCRLADLDSRRAGLIGKVSEKRCTNLYQEAVRIAGGPAGYARSAWRSPATAGFRAPRSCSAALSVHPGGCPRRSRGRRPAVRRVRSWNRVRPPGDRGDWNATVSRGGTVTLLPQ